MKIQLILALALLPVLLIPVYAEQQVLVPLPFDRPFVEQHCITFFQTTESNHGKGRAVTNCMWVWEFDGKISDDIEKIVPDTDVGIPADKLSDPLIALVEDNPPPKVTITTDPLPPLPPSENVPEIDDKLIDTVDKLSECLRGFDRSHEWGAFVDTSVIPFWLNMTREQFGERDQLTSRMLDGVNLSYILKSIEECRAIQRYVDMRIIGPEEALKAVHDRFNIGKDDLPVPQIRGNEQPLNPRDLVTGEDIVAEAQRARDFTCSDDNIARKLCYPYHDFTGVNRGNPSSQPSKDVVVNVPGSENTGLTGVDIYAKYNRVKNQAQAEYDTVVKQIVCDHYLTQYRHLLNTDKFPHWLKHCIAD